MGISYNEFLPVADGVSSLSMLFWPHTSRHAQRCSSAPLGTRKNLCPDFSVCAHTLTEQKNLQGILENETRTPVGIPFSEMLCLFFLWYPLETCQVYEGKMIKIVEFTLCNALGHRHYWNQAHLAQALILLMPTAEGITLHLLPSSAGLVIVAASWPPLLKVVNTTNGYRNGWVKEPANLFPSKLHMHSTTQFLWLYLNCWLLAIILLSF